MFALGAVAFVLALLTSVTLHEAGHFLTAAESRYLRESDCGIALPCLQTLVFSA